MSLTKASTENIAGTVLVMSLTKASTGASRDHLGGEKEMPARSPRLLTFGA